MDFLNDKADRELRSKVGLLANYFDTLSRAVRQSADLMDDPIGKVIVSMVATTILAHGVGLFAGMNNPEEVTNEECYDLLFRANEESVAFIVDVEQALEEAGIRTEHEDGKTPSEVLKEVLAFA